VNNNRVCWCAVLSSRNNKHKMQCINKKRTQKIFGPKKVDVSNLGYCTTNKCMDLYQVTLKDGQINGIVARWSACCNVS
jgi:hypothetical protein